MISVSRSLTKAEKNYVALELKCFAIVFACRKLDYYIYGKDVVVETDHKPLEVITKKSLLVAPRRLQRYNLTVRYRPRCQQVIADTLLRLPVELAPDSEELSTQEVFQLVREKLVGRELAVINPASFVRVKDETLEEIHRAGERDDEHSTLRGLHSRGGH